MKTDQTCVELCPQGTFGEDSQCKNCAEGCLACGGLDACTSSDVSYFLLEGVLTQNCGTGKYGDAADRQCVDCKSECAECTS